MEHYPGLAESPPHYSYGHEKGQRLPESFHDYTWQSFSSPSYQHVGNAVDRNGFRKSSGLTSTNHLGEETSIFDVPEPVMYGSSKVSSVRPAKRSALVGDIPPGVNKTTTSSFPPGVSAGFSGFGLGVGRYGNEIPSPIDAEIQHSILEMQQELAFTEATPHLSHLRHSVRLLKERCAKLENSVDPDWVEVDIGKPIRLTKRVLIPYFRHPHINYVGRILGPKGVTLQNICKKYKAQISIMGAGSTKDPNKEAELLKGGDPKYAHYSSPLHIRVEVVAMPHIAHMRLAGCLNVFNKLLASVREVYIEGITEKNGKADGNDRETEEGIFEKEFNSEDCGKTKPAGVKRNFLQISRGGGTPNSRGGRGGFVPKARL